MQRKHASAFFTFTVYKGFLSFIRVQAIDSQAFVYEHTCMYRM